MNIFMLTLQVRDLEKSGDSPNVSPLLSGRAGTSESLSDHTGRGQVTEVSVVCTVLEMSMSETFSVPFLTLIKLCYTKAHGKGGAC